MDRISLPNAGRTGSAPRTVAVIGCGRFQEGKEGWAIGHHHAAAWRALDPGVRLLGVDPNRENLEAFGKRFQAAGCDLFDSTEALYAAGIPDYVSVCTWPALHAPQVIEAARRGVRGILCEKPMALDGGEIDAMLAACRESGARLAIAHQRLHAPIFQALKRVLHSGVIGDGWVLEARVTDGWDMLSWTVHWFALANWLYDAEPTSLLAGLSHSGSRRYGHAVEDASVVFAEYPSNRQALFVTGPPDPLAAFGPVTVRGSAGLLRVSDKVEIWNREGYRAELADAASDGFPGLVASLIAAVESGAEMDCDAVRCAAATRMAYAAHESSRTRRTVTAPFRTGFAPLEILQHPARPRLPEGGYVLMADEHFGSGGREGIARALTELTGKAPRVVEAWNGLRPEDVDGAAVLLLYHTQPEVDETTR